MKRTYSLLLAILLVTLTQAQNTPIFPQAVPTPAQLGVAANRAETTLATGIGSTDTSIPVMSSSGFKVGSFVTIDSEILHISAIPDGTHLTADQRGTDVANGGGAAAAHLANAVVQARIVAWHINQSAAETIALATHLYGVYVSALDYGVVCDGSTDNSVALQAAIAAAYNGTLAIAGAMGGGTCNYATTLNITSPITILLANANLVKTGTSGPLNITAANGVYIQGNGQALTGWTCSACTSDLVTIGVESNTFADYSFRNFYLVAGALARDHIRINANFYNFEISGVRTDGDSTYFTTGAGIDIVSTGAGGGGDYYIIEKNVIRWVGTGINVAGTSFTNGRISQNQIASTAGRGVSIVGAGQSTVSFNSFLYCNKANTGAALAIVPTSNWVTDLWVVGNSFQANGTASFPSANNIDVSVSPAAGHGLNIHLKDNQFNDVTSTDGAGRSIVMRNVYEATVEGTTIDQTGWVGTGAVDIDASNSQIYYWASNVAAGTTEYLNSAGVTNPWPNIYSPGVIAAATLESTSGGQTVAFTSSIQDIGQNNDNAAVGVNYTGYQFGTTRFRNFAVFDGKHGILLTTLGSTKSVGIGYGMSSPSATLHVLDSTGGTGSTLVKIQAGQGQSGDLLRFYDNPGTGAKAGFDGGGNVSLATCTYAQLVANFAGSADGTQIYCSDCNATCTAGSSTGRTCFRENGAWTH